MTHKIKVTYGRDIKRESVFIDPSISVSVGGGKGDTDQSNIIATGASSGQLIKKLHGKR